ncbi:MAG: glycosyltransferase [Bacteroidota bacterium]|nr:glycosyltransferase [Bacteroidota bacterium]
MPAYNAGKYLRQSIESILKQTFTDFILLIIDDGSTDDTQIIANSIKDSRIAFVKNESNIGLVATLNKGIDFTETEFMARMDADDIAYPGRLEFQLNYLIQNPDIGLCGTRYEKFGDESGEPSMFLTHEEITANLLFSNGICHPSVVIRTSILKENNLRFGVDFDYDDGFGHKLLELEDYALWHKMKSFTRFVNLDRVLLKYRREGQNLSSKNTEEILKRKTRFNEYWLKELGITPDEKILKLHTSFNNIESPTDIELLKKHYDLIILNNRTAGIYQELALTKAIDRQWQHLFFVIVAKGEDYVRCYFLNSNSVKLAQRYIALKAKVRKVIKKK